MYQNIQYDLLYCVRIHILMFIPFICTFFFLFLPWISQLLWESVFKHCIHLQRVKVYWVQENHDAGIYFVYFLFIFTIFPISYSNVIHGEICFKDFSGTTAPKNLKFGSNIGYHKLYCVRENQHLFAYHFLYLSIFSFHCSFSPITVVQTVDTTSCIV